MALSVGAKEPAEKLFMRSRRAFHIANRDKSAMALHRATAHADRRPPKIDPETRAIRLHAIRKAAGKFRNMANVAKSANPDQSLRYNYHANRLQFAADARKSPTLKTKYYNVHQEPVRQNDKTAMAIANAVNASKSIKPALKKKSKIDPATRKTRIDQLVMAGERSKLARKASIAGDEHRAKKLGVSGYSKMFGAGKESREPKRAFDHSLDAQRAHAIAAKFTKLPHQRGKLNKVIQYLRKGQATTGRFPDWRKLAHPLSKFGIKSENQK